MIEEEIIFQEQPAIIKIAWDSCWNGFIAQIFFKDDKTKPIYSTYTDPRLNKTLGVAQDLNYIILRFYHRGINLSCSFWKKIRDLQPTETVIITKGD